jgi:hypothetical protein
MVFPALPIALTASAWAAYKFTFEFSTACFLVVVFSAKLSVNALYALIGVSNPMMEPFIFTGSRVSPM